MERIRIINQENRINYIDILRGIGILFMVMGHIGYGGAFDKYIHAFHMPLFIFISGYFFRMGNSSSSEFIKKKYKTILIPYISFGAFHYLLWLLFFGLRYNLNLIIQLKSLLCFNTNENMPIAGALWFLTCLFIIEITVYFLMKICKKNYQVHVIVILISLFGSVYPLITSVRLPYAADTALVGIGLFYVGYLFGQGNSEGKWVKKLINLPIIPTIFMFVLSTILIFINGAVNMRTMNYSIILLFWINAILPILAYWNIARYFNNCKVRFITIINTELIYIGRNSIICLCLNQFTILLTGTLIKHFISLTSVLNKLLIQIITLVLTIIVLHIITVIISRTKLRVFIGK